MKNTKVRVPAHLRPTTKLWFENVIEAYELDEHHIKLLLDAGNALIAAKKRERQLRSAA